MAIHPYFLYLSISLALLISSCIDKPITEEDDIILARVGQRYLYQSDVDQIIHSGTSAHDSMALSGAFIDQWIRNQLMARQASKFFSSDAKINQLVDDYRSKLLKYYLEEQIISVRYDTVVTDEELNAFYNNIKAQFILHEDLYRCQFMKIARSTLGIMDVVRDWQKGRDSLVQSFSLAYGEDTKLDTVVWYTRGEIDAFYPSWSERKLSKDVSQHQRDKEYEYFLKVLDYLPAGEITPLVHIRPQLIRMILYKRKKKILEDYKQELYEQALQDNLIKLE